MANEQFILGDAGGNLPSVSTGSLSGILDVGSYQFFYDPMIRASNSYGAASATGFIRLEFDSPVPATVPAAVPEPGTFVLMGLGLAGLGLGIRRRRRARG